MKSLFPVGSFPRGDVPAAVEEQHAENVIGALSVLSTQHPVTVGVHPDNINDVLRPSSDSQSAEPQDEITIATGVKLSFVPEEVVSLSNDNKARIPSQLTLPNRPAMRVEAVVSKRRRMHRILGWALGKKPLTETRLFLLDKNPDQQA